MKRRNSPARHALLMVGRNARSYVLLSVTIILSFSFLLGFFVISDSGLYNDYKLTFAADSKIALLRSSYSNYSSSNETVTGKLNMLIYRMGRMTNTHFYQYFEKETELGLRRDEESKITATVSYVPADFWVFYALSGQIPERLDVVSGESRFTADNQIIIDKTLTHLLGGEQMLNLPYENRNGSMELKEYSVIGTIEDGESKETEGETHVRILMPLSEVSEYDKRLMLVYSENGIGEIASLCDVFGIECSVPYKLQNSALKDMRAQVMIKGMSAGILFLLLGINLYSSFKNALNERRFEIGVKLAIGANRINIVGQFFREGMVVMLANTAASVLLVVNLAAVYKAVQRLFYGTEWTISLSAHSAVIFLSSAFFLSVSFSLIFAYRSATVEIAGQLKAE